MAAAAECCGSRVDTPEPLPHPCSVLSFSHRLSAVLLAFALVAGQASVCAGWMSSAEARMACCAADGPCPMHRSTSEHAGTSHDVTQADADRCCAVSEQDDSSHSPSGTAFLTILGAALSPVPALLVLPESHGKIWRATVPIPATHVPKHLLLSVFLV